MTEPDPTLAAIDLMAPAFESSGLDELEVEVGDLHVRLVRPRAPAPQAPPVATSAQPASSTAPLTPYGEPSPGMAFVSAPLTGIWYTAPSPGARPYVNAGDHVASGQVIGLIEAMKLFNEIKSDVAGSVARVIAETGTLVKRQQPLLEIDPRA